MSHKSSLHQDGTARSFEGVEQSLSLVTLPVLVGLVALRQMERRSGTFGGALGQFSESLLQGEQLPILKKVFGRTE